MLLCVVKGAFGGAGRPVMGHPDEEQLFQLHIDRVLVATYTHRGQWPPSYERWEAPGG